MKCSRCNKDVPFFEWFIYNYMHKKCLHQEKKHPTMYKENENFESHHEEKKQTARHNKNIEVKKENKKFVWYGLRISFLVLIISLIYLCSLQSQNNKQVYIFWSFILISSTIFNFIVSIVHLIKHKPNILAIISLVVSSLVIIIALIGFYNGVTCKSGVVCNDICYSNCLQGSFNCTKEGGICEIDFVNNSNEQQISVHDRINLSFFDTFSNCSFDGKLTVDNFKSEGTENGKHIYYTLGETKNGIYTLSLDDYKTKFQDNFTMEISGNTNDCYGTYNNRPFVIYYSDFNLTSDFESGTAHNFNAYENFNTIHESINLSFFDTYSNCNFDGKLTVFNYENGIYTNHTLGETKNGIYTLSLNDYKTNFNSNSTLRILGRTNNCYENNTNILFAMYYPISNLTPHFESGNTTYFDAYKNFNPRSPQTYEAVQDFVRPNETEEYIKGLSSFDSNNPEYILDRLVKIPVYWVEDIRNFNVLNYWQYPNETLKKQSGDCEDWAVAVVSIIREYNNSLSCYDVLLTDHVSVFCFIDKDFFIYDEQHTKVKFTFNSNLEKQENLIKIRTTLNNYYYDYGLDPNQRGISALFNEKELYTFNTNEDVVNWIYYKLWLN